MGKYILGINKNRFKGAGKALGAVGLAVASGGILAGVGVGVAAVAGKAVKPKDPNAGAPIDNRAETVVRDTASDAAKGTASGMPTSPQASEDWLTSFFRSIGAMFGG
jgi:hypothetical protein